MKVIITGVTGMVGEGVLHECLQQLDVEQVCVISRRPGGIDHPKVKEIIHKDFLDLSPIQDQLTGYDACFFCLGVSSVGMSEADYTRFTYDLTLHVAKTLSNKNKEMVFCYVSGASTDSTEKGRLMWARVKGKTENDLAKLPFKKTYNFRPGIIEPTKGLKNTLGFYKYLGWIIPVVRLFTPVVTLQQIAIAMINCVKKDIAKHTLEVKDIIQISEG